MPELEICFLLLTVVGGAMGIGGMVWARVGREPAGVVRGTQLFVAAFLVLGAGGLVAAFHRADGVLPLGLTAGLLVVGMLWDTPQPMRRGPESLALPDEM